MQDGILQGTEEPESNLEGNASLLWKSGCRCNRGRLHFKNAVMLLQATHNCASLEPFRPCLCLVIGSSFNQQYKNAAGPQGSCCTQGWWWLLQQKLFYLSPLQPQQHFWQVPPPPPRSPTLVRLLLSTVALSAFSFGGLHYMEVPLQWEVDELRCNVTLSLEGSESTGKRVLQPAFSPSRPLKFEGFILITHSLFPSNDDEPRTEWTWCFESSAWVLLGHSYLK